MKVQELRVGNIVHYKYGENEYNTVIFVDNEGDVGLDTITGFGVIVEDLEGVPLTTKWLQQLGFHLNTSTETLTLQLNKETELYALFYNETYWIIYLVNEENMTELISGHIKVHQIQNLYSDLTGKELKIKEQH